MVVNYEEHGFKVMADVLPDACTACPFWGIDMRTLETGGCMITGAEIMLDGQQDERRMVDCPVKSDSMIISGLRHLCAEMDATADEYGRKMDAEESWDKLYFEGCENGMRMAAGMVREFINGIGKKGE